MKAHAVSAANATDVVKPRRYLVISALKTAGPRTLKDVKCMTPLTVCCLFLHTTTIFIQTYRAAYHHLSKLAHQTFISYWTQLSTSLNLNIICSLVGVPIRPTQ